MTLRPSAPLFDALADDYDEHFAVPMRSAYDQLAWELTTQALGTRTGLVVDIGCGIGRWATWLIDLGFSVTGIEPAPKMAARARTRLADTRFRLIEDRIETAALPPGGAVGVLAMGSLQYADDPKVAIAKAATWLAPGGVMCVLVDSLVALTTELLRAGKDEEAVIRSSERRGVWSQHGRVADLHLFDRSTLEAAMTNAGLIEVTSHGLLVGASVWGRDELTTRLVDDPASQLEVERTLARLPVLADLGKQLLTIGRAPAQSREP